ncbi:hypothetical protein NL676_030594 [Syzygium grande]|nr:hypothetical protein NL676_030594 [Syzygium grande]
MNGERDKVGDHDVKASSNSQLAQCVLLHELARELQDTASHLDVSPDGRLLQFLVDVAAFFEKFLDGDGDQGNRLMNFFRMWRLALISNITLGSLSLDCAINEHGSIAHTFCFPFDEE